jgi:hypothetical protein
MLTIFINLIKLLRAIWHGVRTDEEFRILLYMLLILLGSATLFYASIEHWSIVDSFYFSVMTMATIGYGDLAPTTDMSKLFTVIFAVLSIGVFAAVVSKIVAIMLERKKQRHNKRNQPL